MSVSCIIPYYNEAARLGPIVDIVASCDFIGEVILVDDGSTDGGFVSNSTKVLHHRFDENRGKAEAMRFGFSLARFEIVVFVDADLKGLSPSHLANLIQPVVSGETDLSVSMREHIPFFDVVSGERALRKDMWRPFFEFSTFQRNAMEIAMNNYALSNQLVMSWIPWQGVSQTYKSQKISWFKGAYRDVRNVVDWMNQLGMFRFGCTYLLSWLLIIQSRSRMTDVYRSLFLRMYGVRVFSRI